MNKKLILSLLFGTMASAVSAQSLTPLFKEMDCGQMLFRTNTEISVELRNNTTQTVRIKDVNTGCGCVAAEYAKGDIVPGQTVKLKLVFDGNQLGHFARYIRITDTSSSTPVEIAVSGEVVSKIINYSGEYPCKLGSLLADVDNIEFDDVNQGQRLKQDINIMNPTGQNVQPTALRLPPYITVKTSPSVIGPKQKGIMTLTLKSHELRDYGLNQTTIYLGKNPADKVTPDKEISVSAVLLPPAVPKNDPSRTNAPKIVMSTEELDMTALARKSKVKGEIIIKNEGKSELEISKMQMFTSGLEVQLGKATLAPGEETKLKITARAKQLKKVKRRPRILMITNDPDRQKIVVYIKK